MNTQMNEIKGHMELKDFEGLLAKADWFHEWSDDSNEIYKGRRALNDLKIIARHHGEAFVILLKEYEDKAQNWNTQ